MDTTEEHIFELRRVIQEMSAQVQRLIQGEVDQGVAAHQQTSSGAQQIFQPTPLEEPYMPTEVLQPMVRLNLYQFLDESFHAYYARLRDLMDEHATLGFYYIEQDLCMSLINGMNSETLDLAQQMCYGRLYCMDFSEC